jgi:hypothetical protein
MTTNPLDDIIRRLAALERRVGRVETRENPGIGARVARTTNQSIANATVTAITFDAERYDTANLWVVGQPTRLTAPMAGWYAIGAHANHDANAVGIRSLFLRLNGATFIGAWEVNAGAAAGRGTAMSVDTVYQLAASDYVEAIVFQTSGGALNILTLPAFSPEFWMHRLT